MRQRSSLGWIIRFALTLVVAFVLHDVMMASETHAHELPADPAVDSHSSAHRAFHPEHETTDPFSLHVSVTTLSAAHPYDCGTVLQALPRLDAAFTSRMAISSGALVFDLAALGSSGAFQPHTDAFSMRTPCVDPGISHLSSALSSSEASRPAGAPEPLQFGKKGIRFVNWTTLWRVSAITLLSTGLFVRSLPFPACGQVPSGDTGSLGLHVDRDTSSRTGQHAGHTMDMSDETMEVDLAYIDMMIPHHASIIALSQVALTELQDERLRRIAEAIIDAQDAEIQELKGYRLEFYGSAEPEPLDEQQMMQLMGDMAKSMDAMMSEMDADAQIAAFCSAENADVAFIDLTIPHHESAIAGSEVVLAQAIHPEIRDFAQRVIDAQQREIDELVQIRLELQGTATPESAG